MNGNSRRAIFPSCLVQESNSQLVSGSKGECGGERGGELGGERGGQHELSLASNSQACLWGAPINNRTSPSNARRNHFEPFRSSNLFQIVSFLFLSL